MTSTTFTDTRNHVWDTRLDLDASERIDAADYSIIWDKPFSLLSPTKEVFSRISTDRRLTMAMIYAMLRPTIMAHPHYAKLLDAFRANPGNYAPIESEEDLIQSEFRKAINGKVMNAACNAFWVSLADFFPDQENIILKFRDAQQEAMRIIETEMESMIEESRHLVRTGIHQSREAFMLKAKEQFADSLGLLSSDLEESSGGLVGSGESSP